MKNNGSTLPGLMDGEGCVLTILTQSARRKRVKPQYYGEALTRDDVYQRFRMMRIFASSL